MFSTKTGWFAVLVTILGYLTATDTLPILTAFINTNFGAHAGQIVGSTLALVGLLVAKVSHSGVAPTTPTTTPTPPAP